MATKKAYSKNQVVSVNSVIQPDGFSSILFKNIGTTAATINDNIPLAEGDTFVWETDRDTVISDTFSVRFLNAQPGKVLIFKVYYR